ncbi:MAG: DUF2071 domain-containing protein [Cyclobacteriaceae bacterium]|nr:DUF2071 domain-containing protein [Cyclobacteriaceae bacterium]
MLSLRNHPFAVETFFKHSLVLTFALPKDALKPLLPPCLEADTLNDQWGFVAAALVTTQNLRPKGFPEFLGNDFILAGFRIFVRYRTKAGKRLRGLYIIKSETNKSRMSFFGNIFTHYNYTTTDIEETSTPHSLHFRSHNSGIDIVTDRQKQDIPLPQGSPFLDWKEARRYAGPLPFTFTYNNKTKEVLIIEGIRQHWEPKPIAVLKDKIDFIQTKFPQAILANAFIVENIPYYWKKGKTEIWKKPDFQA